MPIREAEDVADVRIVPPLVALAAIGTGVLLGWIWPVGSFPGPTALWYGVGGGIIAVAWTLAAWAVLHLRRTGQDPEPWKPTPHLVTGGPYRITRNPIYLGLVLTCGAVGVLLSNPWIVLMTPVCAWVLDRFAIRPEEQYLETRFGAPYREYRDSVRRWI